VARCFFSQHEQSSFWSVSGLFLICAPASLLFNGEFKNIYVCVYEEGKGECCLRSDWGTLAISRGQALKNTKFTKCTREELFILFSSRLAFFGMIS